MTYGIKHKETGLFFAGFGAGDEQLWSACRFTAWGSENRLVAQTQASALVMVGINVQRRPVAL